MRLLLFNLATDADDSILGFAIDWIVELAKHTAHIDIITMRAGGYDLPEHVYVYSVGKEKGYSEARRFVEFYRILLKLLRKNHYDGCFAHMMPLFVVLAAPLLKLKRVPMVLWYAHKSVTWTLRVATLLVDSVVTASPGSFRIPSPKVRVIGHGIDTNKFIANEYAELHQRPFTILTVGRLSPSKRVDRLIEAVRLFRRRHSDLSICLRIVGGPATEEDRKYVAQLQQQVVEASLAEFVEFVGSLPFQQIVSCYQQADCFISFSDTGSLDKAVLEAMSCGLPVIVPPAYAGILGKELAPILVSEPKPDVVCEQIFRVASMPETKRAALGKRLRDIVIHEHALATISSRIFCEFL